MVATLVYCQITDCSSKLPHADKQGLVEEWCPILGSEPRHIGQQLVAGCIQLVAKRVLIGRLALVVRAWVQIPTTMRDEYIARSRLGCD
jgi:hypothetical protein